MANPTNLRLGSVKSSLIQRVELVSSLIGKHQLHTPKVARQETLGQL